MTLFSVVACLCVSHTSLATCVVVSRIKHTDSVFAPMQQIFPHNLFVVDVQKSFLTCVCLHRVVVDLKSQHFFAAEVDGQHGEVNTVQNKRYLCKTVELGALEEDEVEVVIDGALAYVFASTFCLFLGKGHKIYYTCKC